MHKNQTSKQLDNELVICRCEGISLKQIQKSIHDSGVKTINQIKKLTRAGMGLCQGRTCAKLVETILAAEAKIPLGVEPLRFRPPVRGISLGTLAAGSDQFEEPAGPVRVIMTRTSEQEPLNGKRKADKIE